MNIRITPREPPKTERERLLLRQAVEALMRVGWSRKLIHFEDGTILMENSPEPSCKKP